MSHLVLLGDSIFDNAAYVAGDLVSFPGGEGVDGCVKLP